MKENDPVKITGILEEMKSPDPKIKIEAIKQINTVAVAIGKDKAKNELLEYIKGSFKFF